MRGTVLALEGTWLEADAPKGLDVVCVTGPLEAARLLSTRPPSAILFDADVSWQRVFVAGIPSERRPASIAVGGRPTACAHFADEWLPGAAASEELRFRLELARARAKGRQQAARRAFVDPLTGLPNRRAVVREAVRELERSRRTGRGLSLVMIDLDGFKRVNEERGHDEGDRVLRRVGSCLRGSTRESELCGRIGGDEFVAIVAGEAADAARAARRFQASLAQMGVSASVAACELEPGESLKALYRRTDGELRAAKELRRSHASAPLTTPLSAASTLAPRA